MHSSQASSNGSPASCRLNNHRFKLTSLEAAGLEVLQAEFTVLKKNRTANELIAEQTETKEDLLVGLDVSPELAASLPEWPTYSNLMRAVCESGADKRKPPSPGKCPECSTDSTTDIPATDIPVVGVICKKIGKASLHMFHVCRFMSILVATEV